MSRTAQRTSSAGEGRAPAGAHGPAPRARLAETLGGVAYWQADTELAGRAYDEALTIWRERATDGEPANRRELANALYNRAFTLHGAIMSGTGKNIVLTVQDLGSLLESTAASRSAQCCMPSLTCQ